MGRTLAEKVWDEHLVRSAPPGSGEPDLLYIDLHLIHEVTSPQAFDGLRLAGRAVRRPDLTLATEDHNVPTLDWDQPIKDPVSRTQVETLRRNAEEFGVRLHPLGDLDQGIVHVVGPQLGLTQPGMTIVCGDSHTSTHGAFGALAFGIGTSEVEHVLATQTLPQARPKTMAVTVNGALPDGVTAKDLVLTPDHPHRHRRRPGLRRGVPRSRHRGALDGGPDDGVQHEHRVGRQGRPDRTRPDHLRLPRGTTRGAEGRRLGRRGRALADPGHRRRRGLRRGDRARREHHDPLRHLGHQPRPGRAAGRLGPAARRLRRGERPRRCAQGPGVHGPRGRYADARHPRRHRVRRLVHQRPDRGPACGGRDPRGSFGRRGHAPARRPGLGPGPAAGRGGGPRRGLQGGRRRVARRGMLDVSGHEPRPARTAGAQRLDVQPQLRRTAGQGRAHPPGLRPGRRRHRDPRHPQLTRGPRSASRGRAGRDHHDREV